MLPAIAISLDEETTWPRAICQLLEAHLPDLRAYALENDRINAPLEREVVLRSTPPPNPHTALRNQIIAECDAALSAQVLVGLHCTRLHDDESAAIQRDGLRPLSLDGLAERIQTRVNAGNIPKHLGKRLLEINQAGDRGRAGLTWFIFTRRTLSDEHAVSRFFHSWGGEALYNSHEQDGETGPLLCGIGVPYIIEAAVPVERLSLFGGVGEALLIAYLAHRGVQSAHNGSVEGYIQEQLAASHVRRVIRATDPAFRQLTQYPHWHRQLEWA